MFLKKLKIRLQTMFSFPNWKDPSTCPKCGKLNNKTSFKNSIKTVCDSCGHEDEWYYGAFLQETQDIDLKNLLKDMVIAFLFIILLSLTYEAIVESTEKAEELPKTEKPKMTNI